MSDAWPMPRGRLLGVLMLACWLLAQATPAGWAAGLTRNAAPSRRAANGERIRVSRPGARWQEPVAAHATAGAASHLYFAEGFTGQGPQVNFAESLAILNTNPITATGRIVYFLGNGSSNTVAITIPPRARLSENVTRDVGINQQVSALVQADQTISATRTITRTATTGAALSESVSSGENGLSEYWYFAEGYTGVSFQEYVELFNPGDTQASVQIEPYGAAGSLPAASITRTVPAHSRMTINLRAALPNRSLGLLVLADQPIAAERTLYWGAGGGSAKYGTAVNTGISGPSAQWLFPYASTANADQVFLSMIDPNSVEAHVRLTLYDDRGGLTTSMTSIVDPGARGTLMLPSGLGADGGVVGVVVNSDVPVVCEEAQYFGGSPNSGHHAGSIMSGGTAAVTNWMFPGFDTTPFSTERWVVLNTGTMTAHLTATLFTVAAKPEDVPFRAAPGKITSINLGNIHELQNGSASVWSSDAPVIVVQVVRGAQPSIGIVVPGIPQS